MIWFDRLIKFANCAALPHTCASSWPLDLIFHLISSTTISIQKAQFRPHTLRHLAASQLTAPRDDDDTTAYINRARVVISHNQPPAVIVKKHVHAQLIHWTEAVTSTTSTGKQSRMCDSDDNINVRRLKLWRVISHCRCEFWVDWLIKFANCAALQRIVRRSPDANAFYAVRKHDVDFYCYSGRFSLLL